MVAVLFLPLLFFSCGKDKVTSDYVVSENFILHTDISYPEIEIDNIEMLTQTTTTQKFTYALNGSSVELYIDDDIVKTIDLEYIPPVENISVADFNFDGYDDIFIPYEFDKNQGSYWCYIPDKNDFIPNDELNSIGKIMTVSEDSTLIKVTSGEQTESTTEYKWTNNKLIAIRKTEKYLCADDNMIHTDIYNYDSNGVEHLADTIIESN